MQASIYRRNYYLMRSNSNDNTLKDQNKEREIYTETARVINEMIGHTKTLLARINTVREEIEATDISNCENMDSLQVLQGFKEFQKNVPLTFFSHYPLDNKMVGPFVLRLTKEIGYWVTNIPFLGMILQEIDEIFKEQKKNQTENISMIYFMTVKRIISDSHQFFRKIKRKEEEPSARQEERQPTIFLVPTFRLSLNRQNQTKIKNEMLEKMKEKINSLYKCLDIVAFDVIENYIVDLGPEENIELFSKKELKRNKKMKKYVKQYRLDYKDYLERKAKNEEKMRLKKRKLSFSKAAFSLKNSLQKNTASNKSLSNKNGKLSFPAIKHQERDVDNSSNKHKNKEKYKENIEIKEGQFNRQKILLATSKFKLGRGEIKLKL